MMRKFFASRRGNFALMTAIAIVPIMGALALGIDYAEMVREKQLTLNALDAAGIATGRKYSEGASDADTIAYANEFFDANLGGVDPANTSLNVVLPDDASGGGVLTMTATLKYRPYFYPVFAELLGQPSQPTIDFTAQSKVRLKDTLEVALALDNSGSMTELGHGSTEERFTLLKSAAKQLVETLAAEGSQISQLEKPVQFSLVPFAGSVNVGSQYSDASWMDTTGISPIHHENFDWSSFTDPNKLVSMVDGVYYKKGTGWGAQQNQVMTRFTLYNDLQRITGYQQVQTGTKQQQQCTGWGYYQTCKWVTVPVYSNVATYANDIKWEGCVEARPYPYNVDDTAPTTAVPATLYVPMFAPDETDNTSNRLPANNNWWGDLSTSSNDLTRQKYALKYYTPFQMDSRATGMDGGPNAGCTTTAITPLTDVTTSDGLTTIENAIDNMVADGATDVPEGIAWGWRTVSSAAPFTEGRSEDTRGNDKVVILLTDGANTYYTPGSVVAYPYSGSYANYGGNDLAGDKAIYSAYGYTGTTYSGGSTTRLFMGTDSSIDKSTYTNDNYTLAMNEQMASVCTNAKAAGVIVMTVAVDLDPDATADQNQIAGLTSCASYSKFRRDANGNPVKLFWNTTGADLSEVFTEIGNELSNLRIVG